MASFGSLSPRPPFPPSRSSFQGRGRRRFDKRDKPIDSCASPPPSLEGGTTGGEGGRGDRDPKPLEALRLHPHRTARRDRHHRDSRRYPLPRLRPGARKARQTTCLSNIRQFDLAAMMYAQDYDETLPLYSYGNSKQYWSGSRPAAAGALDPAGGTALSLCQVGEPAKMPVVHGGGESGWGKATGSTRSSCTSKLHLVPTPRRRSAR